MKRIKLIGVIAVIMIAAMALSSCGAGSAFTKVVNKDYDLSDTLYTSNSTISELQSFESVINNKYFAIFADTNGEGHAVQKVFSLAENKVVATYTNSSEVAYVIALQEGIPAYVLSYLEDGEKEDDPKEMVYKLYNIKGEEIAKTDDLAGANAKLIADDLFIFDSAAYGIDENKNIVKTVDIPEYISLAGITRANDKYFYDFTDDGVSIYDREFNLCSIWCAPEYADILGSGVLNNGDYLVQYSYELPDDAKDYDLVEDTVKYDLVTVIVNAKTGAEKEVKADFVIKYINPNDTMYNDEAEANENRYTDKFENVAKVVYIENKMYSDDERNADIVVLDNNGKIKGSVRVLDEQRAQISNKIADDRYLAALKNGDHAVVNGKGDVIGTIASGSLAIKGGYLVGTKAVYNADFEVVYDLKENDATVVDYVGNTLFVNKKVSDEAYDIIAIRDGEQKTVLSVTKDTKQTFSVVSGIGYCLADTDGNYKYYNAAGTEIVSLKYSLSVVLTSSAYDTVILKGEDKGVVVYHQFDIAE